MSRADGALRPPVMGVGCADDWRLQLHRLTKGMNRLSETDLYAPVKSWLVDQGFDVKSEVSGADIVAVKADAPPVIVEMKTGFSLTLLQQAVARQAISDLVYVAVPRWKGKAGWRTFKGNVGLCKRLALGVISVRLEDGFVQVHADPKPFQPRKSKRKASQLLSEYQRRTGDPNTGGTRGKIVTAYLQDAERCAAYIAENGPAKGSVVRDATGVTHATRMMRDNHYGWFEPLGNGIYDLTEKGQSREPKV